jgi:hypothetical protein
MDYDNIRAEIKTRLEAVSSPQAFVSVYDTVPDFLTPPCAIVVPSSNLISYHEAMGTVAAGLKTLRFSILIAAQRFEASSSQEILNDYLVTVPTALEADPTLNGECETLQVTQAINYGPITFADSVYLSVQLDLEVYAR